jgi:16S rRNA processing protein RimM
MKKQFIECGKIVSTHGVRGEVKIQPWADSPEFLCEFKRFYLDNGAKTIEAERVRTNKNMVLLKIAGVDTVDDGALLRGKIVYIDRADAAPNEDGTFFIQDLVGLEVRDADSPRIWGKLTDVLFTGANDVYEITDSDGTKRLVPVIPDVVLETDLAGGYIVIRPLKGLFEDE